MIVIFYDKNAVAEYAKSFNRIALPKSALPINLRVLCFDVANYYSVTHNIITVLHRHTFFEIHSVLEGEMAYECEGRIIRLHRGEALLIPPETEHKYMHASEDLVKSVISFTIDKSDVELLKIKNLSAKEFAFSEEVFESHDFIFRLHGENNALAPHLILGRITEILYSVSHTLGIEFPTVSDKNTDPRFLTAKAFIDKNSHRILTCEDVAKECCLSAKQMGRIVYAATGMSLSQYIVSAKLERAKELLLSEQKYSVKEICFMLGFESESSFTLFFKRHEGTPPSAYRLSATDAIAAMTASDGEK